MRRRLSLAIPSLLTLFTVVVALALSGRPAHVDASGLQYGTQTGQPAGQPTGQAQAAPNPDAWIVPDDAAEERNPVEPTAEVLMAGKALYQKNCQRCHGLEGKGDGPEADPKEKPDDLSDARRAARNPDGIMYYKVWNGRKKPKMPAFGGQLDQQQVWTLIQYVKTLRKPAA